MINNFKFKIRVRLDGFYFQKVKKDFTRITPWKHPKLTVKTRLFIVLFF